MNYERAKDHWLLFIVYLGPDFHGFTFVASKFAVISLLCSLDAISQK